MQTARIAVVGHAEHVCLGRTAALPAPGDIVHLSGARALVGGGGALAFAQLCRSDAEAHFFTAVGDDEAGREVEAWLGALGGRVHAARRAAPHPRVVGVVDAEGRRTLFVTSPPLQPTATDALPWEKVADLDAVYFTGDDPGSLRLARR
ncbi:MAG TPA: PfkB family carbohydrate kinase, partial [Polyangiaceae bacterium]|nr:PfkB family carbohydrate kinase [Polyangiaceae bacterium]